jgi:hypothetical protein
LGPGIEDGKVSPVRVKKHGYPQCIVFKRVLNLLNLFYKHHIVNPLQLAIEAAWRRFGFFHKTVG